MLLFKPGELASRQAIVGVGESAHTAKQTCHSVCAMGQLIDVQADCTPLGRAPSFVLRCRSVVELAFLVSVIMDKEE